MTRPPKETDMKREHRVTIRLTDTEFSIIENAAEQAEMSISEYMRTQTMQGQSGYIRDFLNKLLIF